MTEAPHRPVIVKQWGLQKSGTNVTRWIIEQNLTPIRVQVHEGGWKHATPRNVEDFAGYATDALASPDHHIVTVRDPRQWLASFKAYSRHDPPTLPSNFPQYSRRPRNADEIMRRWAGYLDDYLSWNRSAGDQHVALVDYDRVVSDTDRVLDELVDLWGVCRRTPQAVTPSSSVDPHGRRYFASNPSPDAEWLGRLSRSDLEAVDRWVPPNGPVGSMFPGSTLLRRCSLTVGLAQPTSCIGCRAAFGVASGTRMPDPPRRQRRFDAMIIGGQKCGTTSLLRYVGQHPNVATHHTTEFAWFADPAPEVGLDECWDDSFGRVHDEPTFVGKSAVLAARPDGLRRLAEHNPRCELFLLMRNPVERALSSYRMEDRLGTVDEPFTALEERLDTDHWWHRVFVELGNYPQLIENVFEVFPAAQLHLLVFDDLLDRPRSVVAQLFDAIGLEDSETVDTERVFNAGSAPGLRDRISRRLRGERMAPVRRLAKAVVPADLWARSSRTMTEGPPKAPGAHAAAPAELGLDLRFLRNYYEPQIREVEALLDRRLDEWR